ncbi:MAG: glycosyltransferase family 4 protein [Phycisphaeraceae bacterium]
MPTSYSKSTLHVISGLFYGGGQQVVLDLLEALPGVGREGVSLCVLGDRDAKMAAAASHRVRYDGRYNRLGTLWRVGRELRGVLREAEPGVVHSHGWDASMATAIALRGTGRPHVVHWHTTDSWLETKGLRQGVRRSMTRWLFRQPNAHIIAVSGGVQSHLCSRLRLPREQVQVIWNGIDAAKYIPASFNDHAEAENNDAGSGGGASGASGGGGLVIGTAARLAPMKGLEYLIEALAKVRDRGVNFTWRVAGEGGSRAELEALAAERGLTEHVQWLGRLDGMTEFYRSLDLFALPSVSFEGLPLAILEAMASGVPVLSTRIAGIPEAVHDGEQGLLVSPRDAEALAAAVEQFAADPEHRRQMGERARQRVLEEFTIERTAEKFSRLYDKLLTNGST